MILYFHIRACFTSYFTIIHSISFRYMENQQLYLDIYSTSKGFMDIEKEWKPSHSGLPLVLHISSRFSPSLVSPWGNPTTIFTSGLSAEKKNVNLETAIRSIYLFHFHLQLGFVYSLTPDFETFFGCHGGYNNKRSDKCNFGHWQHAGIGCNNTP